jgi:hypothetical protein
MFMDASSQPVTHLLSAHNAKEQYEVIKYIAKHILDCKFFERNLKKFHYRFLLATIPIQQLIPDEETVNKIIELVSPEQEVHTRYNALGILLWIFLRHLDEDMSYCTQNLDLFPSIGELLWETIDDPEADISNQALRCIASFIGCGEKYRDQIWNSKQNGDLFTKIESLLSKHHVKIGSNLFRENFDENKELITSLSMYSLIFRKSFSIEPFLLKTQMKMAFPFWKLFLTSRNFELVQHTLDGIECFLKLEDEEAEDYIDTVEEVLKDAEMIDLLDTLFMERAKDADMKPDPDGQYSSALKEVLQIIGLLFLGDNSCNEVLNQFNQLVPTILCLLRTSKDIELLGTCIWLVGNIFNYSEDSAIVKALLNSQLLQILLEFFFNVLFYHRLREEDDFESSHKLSGCALVDFLDEVINILAVFIYLSDTEEEDEEIEERHELLVDTVRMCMEFALTSHDNGAKLENGKPRSQKKLPADSCHLSCFFTKMLGGLSIFIREENVEEEGKVYYDACFNQLMKYSIFNFYSDDD